MAKSKKSKASDDESKMQEVESRRVISVIQSDDEEDDQDLSLADRIAAKRNNRLGRVGSIRERIALSPDTAPKLRRKAKEEDAVQKKKSKKMSSEDQVEKEEFSEIGKRKLKVNKKSDSKACDIAKQELDEVEKFLKENPDVEEATNSSLDVMKELDELLKD